MKRNQNAKLAQLNYVKNLYRSCRNARWENTLFRMLHTFMTKATDTLNDQNTSKQSVPLPTWWHTAHSTALVNNRAHLAFLPSLSCLVSAGSSNVSPHCFALGRNVIEFVACLLPHLDAACRICACASGTPLHLSELRPPPSANCSWLLNRSCISENRSVCSLECFIIMLCEFDECFYGM